MDFNLNGEQTALQDTARKFAAEFLTPHAAEWDEREKFPVDTIKRAAELGLAGIYIAPEFSGSGLSRLDGALLFEELAYGCISTTAYLTVHNMVGWMIATFGSDMQKREYLPAMCRAEKFSSYCLTEPSSGSDAASLQTRAVKKGGDYIIDGTKSFITMGGISDVYVVMARTGGDGAGGISAFLVDKSSPGLSFGKPEQKMGWRNQPTTTVNFDSVRVPQSNLLGGEGEGFKMAMRALDGGRVNIASCSLGGGRRAMDMAGRYMHERRQFNKSLAEFQSLQFKMANMAIAIDASRLMTHRAAAALDAQHADAGLYAAMAKKMASESAFSAADEALQIHGGYGYIRDYEIERVLRDLRVNRILEGTNEIMQIIIARKILESYRID